MKYIFLYLLLVASFSEGIAQTLQDTIYKSEMELVIGKLRGDMLVGIPSNDLELPGLSIIDIKGVQVGLPYNQDIQSYYLPYIKIYIDSKDFLFAQQLNEYDDPDSDINQRVLSLTQSAPWNEDVTTLKEYFSNGDTILSIIRSFDFGYDANLEYHIDLRTVKIKCIDHQFFIYFQFQ